MAKTTIAERKLDVFDYHYIDFGNQNVVLAIENEKLLNILRSRLPNIRCETMGFFEKQMTFY